MVSHGSLRCATSRRDIASLFFLLLTAAADLHKMHQSSRFGVVVVAQMEEASRWPPFAAPALSVPLSFSCHDSQTKQDASTSTSRLATSLIQLFSMFDGSPPPLLLPPVQKRTALGLEMEKLFEILRVSTDNEARKQASVRLRQIQEQHPEDFLQHTWEHITSPSTPEDTRFFLSTVIIAFVEQSWHHGVGRVTQERFLGLYTQLAISTPAQSPLLTRKIATIVAAMVRRGTNKTQMGETLPPLLQAVVTSYSQHLQESLQHGSMPTVARDLLNIHLLLKEMQSSRIGHIFEHLCAALVEPLSAVFQCCSTGTELLEAHYYYVFLYWLKCSLRIFGRGIFEVMFYPTLLQLLWQLAVGLGQDSNNSSTGDNAMRRIRLLEYGVKVLEKTVVYFPDRLTMLGLPFFVEVAAERRGVLTSDHSLLFLLCSIVGSPVHDVVSEKLVCRSMRLVTSFLSAEDGDEFVAHVLVQWSCSSADTFGRFLRRLITGFLADDVSGSTLQKWKADPERAAAELDVDMDDEDAPMSCAEQLFIALTGSTACGTASLTTAWTVVNELLTDGSAEKVTAGLHAIGIGYYTMASSDTASYLAFLHDKLLPLLYPATMSAVSPFVLRRVVWLIGMWCESVTQTADRQAVLQCLIEVLQQETSAAAPSMTLLLVCLRSVENFISDNNFQTIDVPANFVEVVLTTIQGLLVQVRGASAIKALAGLVHVLVEKSVLQSNGEALLVLFEPPAVHLIQSYEAAAKSGAADGDDDDDDEWQSGADGDTMGSLVALLECLESSVKLCNRDEAIWVLFNSIVVPCTTPEQAVTPLASDDAWELFLTMCRMTQSFAHSLGEAGLHWTLRHLGRDFEMLPLVYRILYTIFAGWPGSVEEVLQHTDVEQWLSLLSESVSAELCSAVVPVLLVVVRRSSGPLCAALCRRAAHLLVTAEDVQGAPDSIFLAMLLSVAVASSVSAEQQVAQLLADVAQSSKTPSDLLEQLVLLLDVSPSELVSRSIGRLMQCICAAVPLSEADAGMVNRAREGIEVASATAVTSVAGHGDDVSERRTFEDQLLELLGDEGVSADASCPHVVRIVEQFSILRW